MKYTTTCGNYHLHMQMKIPFALVVIYKLSLETFYAIEPTFIENEGDLYITVIYDKLIRWP